MANVRSVNKESGKIDKIETTSKCSLVYMNDGVRICAQACSCCWDKTIPEDYQGQVEYLARRCKTGHTSILEHSNFVVVYKLPSAIQSSRIILNALDFLANNQYLHTAIRQDTSNAPWILIGGSYRAFDDVYHKIQYKNGDLIGQITKQIYECVNGKIFPDLTSKYILAEERFLNVEPDPVSKTFNPIGTDLYEDDKVKFISIDNIEQIKKNLRTIIGEDIFTNDDIARVATTTILFKDMSRTGTHQLVRHRNGITQESQRYVNYSQAAFADPLAFKLDKYDINKKYDFEFGGQKFSMTSNEIGENIIGIYQYMIDQGMMKEDARSFLPGNVKCRKLYMTFTYDHLLKFIELRCHVAAQAEIRTFAMSVKQGFEEETAKFALEADKDENAVDEIITDKEVIMNNIIDNTPELKEEETKND